AADKRLRPTLHRNNVRMRTRTAQVVSGPPHFRGRHSPDVDEEVGGRVCVVDHQLDTAKPERHGDSPCERPAARIPASAHSSSQSPVSPLMPTAPEIWPSPSRIRQPPGDSARLPPLAMATEVK